MPITNKPPLDTRVIELLKITAEILDDLGVNYAVVGGIAMITHGVIRNTADVDVFLPEADMERILDAFEARNFRIDSLSDFHFIAVKPGHNVGDDATIRIDLMFPCEAIQLFGMRHALRDGMWGISYRVLRAPVLAAIKFMANDDDPECWRHGMDVDLLRRAGLIDLDAVATLISDSRRCKEARFVISVSSKHTFFNQVVRRNSVLSGEIGRLNGHRGHPCDPQRSPDWARQERRTPRGRCLRVNDR